MPRQPRPALLLAFIRPAFGQKGYSEQAGGLPPKGVRVETRLDPKP